jgi:AcrR family transcriptional regulator
MELYRERGFDSVTVAEIAERAGLTERTFFRYFADKREVLFGGASALQELLVARVIAAPALVPPMEAIAGALTEAAVEIFEDRQEFARQRQAVIGANAELQERELIKLSTLAAALAGALRERGVSDPAASLAGESGIAVFKISFERWTGSTGGEPLSEFIRDCMEELKVVTAGPSPAVSR